MEDDLWRMIMEDKIMEILQEINEEIPNYTGDNLYEDRLLDSFQVIELVEQLEDTWNIEIPPEMIVMENFASKDAIISLVKKLAGKNQ